MAKVRNGRRFAVGGAVVAMLGLLSQCIDDASDVEDRRFVQQQHDAWADLCADPAAARGLQKGLNTDVGMICPTVGDADVALPVADLPPGSKLAEAYLVSLRTLLVTVIQDEPLRRLVPAINRGGLHAEAIAALNFRIRQCHAVPPPSLSSSSSPPRNGTAGARDSAAYWGIDIQPSTVRTLPAHAGAARLSVRVVERTPTCVTGGEPQFGQVAGTTDLDLTFTTGTGSGNQPVWLLTALTACPVRPDPLLRLPSTRLRAAVLRTDDQSLFTTMSEAC